MTSPTNQPGRTWTTQQLVQGAHVVDATGDKVGPLIEYDQTQGYLLVEKGWLFPQDVYIPVAAINTADADTITLSYTKQELQDRDWTTPPEQSTASAKAHATTASTVGPPPTAAQTGAATEATNIRVPLREEELVVGKQQQEAGQVHLHKEVVSEQQTVTTPVTHEKVSVERVAVTGDTPVSADAFVERDIDVPVMGEEAVTGKRAKTVEEVRLRKNAVTEQQEVTDTVRKERLTVQDDNHLATNDPTTNDETRRSS